MRPPTSFRAPEAGGAAGPALPLTAEDEVARILAICNACRYCEGFCAVFPAMTRRLDFPRADAHYLANLCHNCGACLHACQYAPPHPFAVNVPRAMARLRAKTYQDYAWPPALGRLYRRGGLTAGLALAAGLSAFLILALAFNGGLAHAPADANFYAIFPHDVLAALFGAVFLFAAAALAAGVRRFWREVRPPGTAIGRPALAEAATDVARLRYLGGGHGEGCNEQDDRFTLARRLFHQLTLYGFLLCFAATAVATLYHYLLGREAPYAWTSLPVGLGVAGGIGLTAGVAGLFWLNLRRHPDHGDPAQQGTDRAFMGLLLLVSLSGFAVLILRADRLMGLWLAIHLGSVMALFLTLPYGKFAHGLFRCAALLKYAVEKRLPNGLSLGSD